MTDTSFKPSSLLKFAAGAGLGLAGSVSAAPAQDRPARDFIILVPESPTVAPAPHTVPPAVPAPKRGAPPSSVENRPAAVNPQLTTRETQQARPSALPVIEHYEDLFGRRPKVRIGAQHKARFVRSWDMALGTYNGVKNTENFSANMDALRYASAQMGCSISDMAAVIYLESALGTIANTHQGDAMGMGQIREVTAQNLARIYRLQSFAPFHGRSDRWFSANRDNRYINALLTCATMQENRVLLSARGLQSNPANQYIMHNMGSESGTNVLRNIQILFNSRGDAWKSVVNKTAFDLVPESYARGNPGYLMTGPQPADITSIAYRYTYAATGAQWIGNKIASDTKNLPVPTLSFKYCQGREYLVSSFSRAWRCQTTKPSAAAPQKANKSSPDSSSWFCSTFGNWPILSMFCN